MGKIKLQNFAILLDRNNVVFGPGDYVSGNCYIVLNGELDLNQLEVKLSGKAKTEWTEQETRGTGEERTTETVTYSDSHKYLKMSQRPANGQTVYQSFVQAGQYNIPFTFQLPLSGTASSFEGQYGHIRYHLKAIIHKPELLTLKSKHKAEVPINICFPAVASIQQLSTPIALSEEKTVGCCCYAKLVQLKASIAKTGQIIGSASSINCTTVNTSNKEMQLKAKLKQKITYKAKGKTKCNNKDITTVMGSTISPGQTANESLSMPIPYDLPVLYNQCSIIDVKHQIEVTLEIPGSIDLHIKLPVIITNQDFLLNNS